jgi:hypothetical protein
MALRVRRRECGMFVGAEVLFGDVSVTGGGVGKEGND